jgi:hypothetical protein
VALLEQVVGNGNRSETGIGSPDRDGRRHPAQPAATVDARSCRCKVAAMGHRTGALTIAADRGDRDCARRGAEASQRIDSSQEFIGQGLA